MFSPCGQVDRSPAISWSDVAERATETLDYQQSTILQRVMVHKKVKGNGSSDIYIVVLEHKYKNQSGPRYEEQLTFMSEPIPHSKRPPRTPSRRSSYFAVDGRARTDSSIMRHVDTVEHQFDAICGGGGGVCRGPRTTTSDSNFARGLVTQASTRDTLSCMDPHQPTGSHGHVSGPLVKADMVHKFRRGYDSQDPIGYLDRERDRACTKESHSYSRQTPETTVIQQWKPPGFILQRLYKEKSI